jgi:endonuclease G
LEKVEPDPDYNNRPGYVRDFLGFEVPLPQPTGTWKDQVLEIPGADADNPYELKYYHYSVIMNKERRLAFISAVNIDPTAPVKYPRDKGDKWFFDPRIDDDFQLGEELYAGNPLDRGHLTRRDDAAWGDTKPLAKLANDDTFHFTNCSPQHEIFNQSTLATNAGVTLWGNLENYISKQGKDNQRRLTVFNGPIFGDNDRLYRKVALLPKEFWKIVIFEDDDGSPKAAAFKLSQASLITKAVLTEKISFEPYQTFQVPIADLMVETGLDFTHVGSLGTKSTDEDFKESMHRPRAITNLSQIKL